MTSGSASALQASSTAKHCNNWLGFCVPAGCMVQAAWKVAGEPVGHQNFVALSCCVAGPFANKVLQQQAASTAAMVKASPQCATYRFLKAAAVNHALRISAS
jgi:hypothetical protein